MAHLGHTARSGGEREPRKLGLCLYGSWRRVGGGSGFSRAFSSLMNFKWKSGNLKQGKGEGEVAPIVSYQNQLRSLEERASVRGGGLAPYRVA